jgi:hypothetical protein
MINVNLNRLRDRIQPDVRVRLDTEFRLDELNQAPGRRKQPARPAGKLNPALLAFNDTVRSHNVVRMVRRWIIDHGLAPQPHNPQVMALNVISEARVRIARYKEEPVTALSYAAVLNTAIYRDNSVSFDTLVAQARQDFAARV